MLHWLGSRFRKHDRNGPAPADPRGRSEADFSIEELEVRRLPAADITSLFALQGTSAADPVVAGHLDGDPVAGIRLEFDRNNDLTVDGTVLLPDPAGDFTFDLREIDPTLDEFEGTLAVRARPVDLDSQGAEIGAGEWVSTEFFLFGPPPTLADFAGCEGAGDDWTFTGTVGGSHASGATIEFGGVLAGHSAQADSWGNFGLSIHLGTVDGMATAKVIDSLGQESETAEFYCASLPDPVMAQFGGSEGADDYWTFSGSVTGPTASGATIYFGGILSGFSTQADSEGNFNATFQLGNVDGTATAQAVDGDGRVSGCAEAYCVSQPDPDPWQLNFSGVEETDDYWAFTGSIYGTNYEGAVISFSGLLDGHTASVDSGGNFSLNVYLGNVDGIASAHVVDPTNQGLQVDWYCLSQPDPEPEPEPEPDPLVITDFAGALQEGYEDYWLFTGSVTGTYAVGATVTFGGVLDGVSAVVQQDGTFAVSVTTGGSGIATAVAAAGGAQSNVAEYYVVT